MKTAVLRLKRQEFSSLLKEDLLVVYNRLGTLKYRKNTPNKAISIITSYKHQKLAVNRNKTRRRVYSLFQQSEIVCTAIFYISKQAYSMEYGEIKKLFEDLLAKINKNT